MRSSPSNRASMGASWRINSYHWRCRSLNCKHATRAGSSSQRSIFRHGGRSFAEGASRKPLKAVVARIVEEPRNDKLRLSGRESGRGPGFCKE